jgi:quinoprotein glucose dehydrogenase
MRTGANRAAIPAARVILPLRKITRENVTHLRPAWEYHTGALAPAMQNNEKAAFEATPILVDGTLYLRTPYDTLIALDPATGKQRWKFDPEIKRDEDYSEVTSRGVASWVDPARHRRRIFIGTLDARLIAIDAANGKLTPDFGQIDLSRAVAHFEEGNWHNYEVTSLPAVVGNLVIVGSSIGDNRFAAARRSQKRRRRQRVGAPQRRSRA